MSDFTVYRGKCSPEQLRKVLLMAMTVKNIEEVASAKLKSKAETPMSDDHIFFPSSWCYGNSQNNRVEFCNYERARAVRGSGVILSHRTELFDIPWKCEGVIGVSFWDIAKLSKKSKSGNFFEATQNLKILAESEGGDGLLLSATFDICVRERVIVTEWGFKMHSRWLDFLRAAGVEYWQDQE